MQNRRIGQPSVTALIQPGVLKWLDGHRINSKFHRARFRIVGSRSRGQKEAVALQRLVQQMRARGDDDELHRRRQVPRPVARRKVFRMP